MLNRFVFVSTYVSSQARGKGIETRNLVRGAKGMGISNKDSCSTFSQEKALSAAQHGLSARR